MSFRLALLTTGLVAAALASPGSITKMVAAGSADGLSAAWGGAVSVPVRASAAWGSPIVPRGTVLVVPASRPLGEV
jgi:hypothetical protein